MVNAWVVNTIISNVTVPQYLAFLDSKNNKKFFSQI